MPERRVKLRDSASLLSSLFIVDSVKLFRVLLVLLLVLSLPARGALVAAMVCEPVDSGHPTERVAHDHSANHMPDVAGHGHAAHDRVEGHAHPSPISATVTATAAAASDSCHLCCDLCSLSPLVSQWPSLAGPQHLSNLAFPDVAAPLPSFVSEGQERPPRTI